MKGEPQPEEREIRIDLPVRAFIPPGWLEQESLRLELYRRISTAAFERRAPPVRAEAEDRFGVLPPEVGTLFAIGASSRCGLAAGIEEISRFRDQIRVKPVDDAHGLDPGGVA